MNESTAIFAPLAASTDIIKTLSTGASLGDGLTTGTTRGFGRAREGAFRLWYGRPMSQNLYTSVASSMLLHSNILTSRMANVPLGRSKRVLQISELSGPSSNAGALARQSLMLAGGGEQPVCGWVDFSAAVAEVRDFATTKAGYESRYRKTFDLTEDEYRGWLQKVQAIFKELEVRCTITGDDAISYGATDSSPAHVASEDEAEPERATSSSFLLIALGLGLTFVAGAVIFFLVRR